MAERLGAAGPAGVRFLRRLAAHDESAVRALRVGPRMLAPDAALPSRALDHPTRSLIELAALLAVDAPTSSVRWAAERAGAAGADDRALVEVLQSAVGAAGSAQTVKSAGRLALALDLDLDPADDVRPAAPRRSLAPLPPNVTRLPTSGRRRGPGS